MSSTFKKIVIIEILLLTYGLFFYFTLTQQLNTDFRAFYNASISYIQGVNPFSLDSYSLFKLVEQPINLNPPFFLQLLTPLNQIPFHTAWLLWSIVSFCSGIIGALICLRLASTPVYFKKNWLSFILIYLCMYSSLMNTSFSQLGGFLLFFTMIGYYFYLHKQDFWAGFIWGFIIAVKLFPALLFIFVLQQRRYKVFAVMFISCLIMSLWPVFIKGPEIYMLYFTSLSGVLWYGASWNASVFGFLFRLLTNQGMTVHFILIKISYLLVFLCALFLYLRKMKHFQGSSIDHRAFCLTLVMMLVLSPLGWIYYFSLLLMPLTLIWFSSAQKHIKSYKTMAAWPLSLFLINFPQGNALYYTEGFLYKITIGSLYFYGLILIAYQLSCLNRPILSTMIITEPVRSDQLVALKVSLGLGLSVVLYNLLSQL